MTWAILDDGYFHFSEEMSVSELEGQPMPRIIFPGSNLNTIAAQMIQKQPLKNFTFLEEWTHKYMAPTIHQETPQGEEVVEQGEAAEETVTEA